MTSKPRSCVRVFGMGRKAKDAERDTVQVRVILTGLLKERFLYLRDKYGATTNKSLVEMLITEKHAELTKGGG